MAKRILLAMAGLVAGVSIGYLVFFDNFFAGKDEIKSPVADVFSFPSTNGEVTGFLPFWLLDRAQTDYSNTITTLSYFALTIDKDGTIMRYTNPIEGEPGWFALKAGKLDSFFESARKNDIKLSLAVFNSDDDSISLFLSDPAGSAKNLVDDAAPVMAQYGFSDLNLDVESFKTASPEARIRFAQFVSEVKKNMVLNKLGTLTIDISPIAFVKDDNLINPSAIASSVDKVVLMAYDFHNPGSFVTGANSPVGGAGVSAEFDTKTAIEKALEIMPSEKLILGVPLYGYQWETINPAPKSAVLPSSSIIISTKKVQDFLATTATISAQFDKISEENYVVYKDADTGTYHQIFYPDKATTKIKIDLAKSNRLGGIALWALGYEDKTILSPLASYRPQK